MKRFLAGLALASIMIFACEKQAQVTDIPVKSFGQADGQDVMIYKLENVSGAYVELTTYGAAVVSINVPDKDGNLGDVVAGFDSAEDYVTKGGYEGAIVGRYGNRIAVGKFSIDGTEYQLPINNNGQSLHGGNKGFDKVVWQAAPKAAENGKAVAFTYVSADGEMGYPGELTATVTYTWTDENELIIDYLATTDKPTVVNLTNHSYFNLKDGGASSILDHILMINADAFTPVTDVLIPTGEIASVEDTPFDFTTPMTIGSRIEQEDGQLAVGGGYDHNYVLNNQDGTLALAAVVSEPTTGRMMQVMTTEPGIQFYSGNFMNGIVGKNGTVYEFRHAFCLETQHYPDSPNQPEWPSTLLKPGNEYKSKTIYKFSVK